MPRFFYIIFGALITGLFFFSYNPVFHTSDKIPPVSLLASANTQKNTQPISKELYPVVRVVDGDTIIVRINEMNERIRLIGINAPESVDPRRPVQCFGREASAYMKSLISGKDVRLEADSTQSDRDKYGRLLRYIYLADGVSINKKMIEDGYAYEYTYHTPYLFQTEFKQAEKIARKEKVGLWADNACK